MDGVRDMAVKPPRAGASAAEYITAIRAAHAQIVVAKQAMKAIAAQADADRYDWEMLRNAANNSAKPRERVELMCEYLAEFWAEETTNG